MRRSNRSDVRYCTQCGIGTGTDDRFCPNCGKELPDRGESSSRPDTGQRRDERRSYRPGASTRGSQRPEVHVENKSGGFGSGFAQGCGCSVGLIVALLLGIVLLFMVCTVAIVT